MRNKTRALLVFAALVMALLACNLPNFQANTGVVETPGPNLTLTALYAVTATQPAPDIISVTATPTLPPIITATPSGGANPTATTGAGTVATNTPAANPTATKAIAPSATTAASQPTASTAGVRPRAAVTAKFLTTPPTIDGDWSEWKDLTTEYPANNVVWGKNNWSGQNDLSASFHIGWDNTNLYIAVKVIDDTYVQNASGENMFKGDSIEIVMDTKLQEDFYYNRLSPDDFQLGISPGRPDINGTKEVYLWMPENIASGQPGVKVAAKQENGQYRVEAAIPWTVFEMTPGVNQHYGFALSVSDNDSAGQNAQQSMVSNDPNRSLADPTSWGDLQLTK